MERNLKSNQKGMKSVRYVSVCKCVWEVTIESTGFSAH